MGVIREILVGPPKGETRRDLEEQRNQALAQASFLEESLDQLERATTGDEGWRKMGAAYEQEFTRGGLKDIVTLSRAMYMAYPLIQRAVNVTTFYTWGQGFSVSAEEDQVQDLVDELMTNPVNQAELYDHQAQILLDVDQLVDGNVFIAMDTDTIGDVELRAIPSEQIERIYCEPGNPHRVQYYHRMWTEEELDLGSGATATVTKEALHPDWRYYPDDRPDNAGSVPIEWDQPIVHQKSGGLRGMKFGVPSTYSSFEWARAYKKFLEDWHTLVASLAKFAWKVSTKENNVSRVKRKLDADADEATGTIRNRATAAGGAAITDPDTDITPIPKTGATTSADDAKPSRLMIASAMNIPDTLLSNDPQQGALATAKTLDRPTELYMGSRQLMWKSTHNAIFQYAVLAKQRRSQLPEEIDTDVEITFPSILEHDLTETIDGIVKAATLGGQETAGTIPMGVVQRMLMDTLGVDNIDQALEQLDEEDAQRVDQLASDLEEVLRGQGLLS